MCIEDKKKPETPIFISVEKDMEEQEGEEAEK
jgi:hypothetical protein